MRKKRLSFSHRLIRVPKAFKSFSVGRRRDRSLAQLKKDSSNGRYVFSWGGGERAEEFGFFVQKKVLALPHVLKKKLPPLLGD